MDLYDFREDYTKGALRRATLRVCPFEQFRHWFEEAKAGGIHEPNAMSLATVDEAGAPLQRTVLLKSVDERGFVFFTNYLSRKAQQLEANAQICALFPWVLLERQVIIQGRAEKISREESAHYFASRPRGNQLGAWVSHQSQPVPDRASLERELHEVNARFEGKEVPLPDFWGGYRIVPHAIEFWQGGSKRLHDRFLYERQDAGWEITRLSP